MFCWQSRPQTLRIYSDADWAGCKATRRSTTGSCVTLGKHSIKGWSKTQSLVALSSGESELYATLKASAETLGMLSIMKDLGWSMSGEIWGDASAALGIIHRRGLGKTRHIDTGLLWVQQTAAEKRLSFHKVLGKVNPADLYTKYMDEATTSKHTKALAHEFAAGRAEEAPKLHLLEPLVHEEHADVLIVSNAMNNNKGLSKYSRERLSYGGMLALLGLNATGWNAEFKQDTMEPNTECEGRTAATTTTYTRQRVLWGSKWRARLDHPRGSTLTFQHNTSVSCGTCLKHGETMHPRGRHLKEGMIPLSRGTYTELAREQQPPQQPPQHYH